MLKFSIRNSFSYTSNSPKQLILEKWCWALEHIFKHLHCLDLLEYFILLGYFGLKNLAFIVLNVYIHILVERVELK